MKAVQRLLYPIGFKNLADAAIEMPSQLRDYLVTQFSFDIGGCAELEGDKIYKALCGLHAQGQRSNVCEISIWVEKGDKSYKLRVLTPIDKAFDTVDFINDQLSEQPKISLAVPTGFKRDVQSHERFKSDADHSADGDAIGWIDLDTPSMIFVDLLTSLHVKKMLGCENVPTIDANLDYVLSCGTIKEGVFQMGVLAKHWNSSISCDCNDKKLVVSPTGLAELGGQALIFT